MLKCSFNKCHHPNVVIFETTRSLYIYNQILEILNITFKLVFKEYLTPNVMQIILINQVPYIGMCS